MPRRTKRDQLEEARPHVQEVLDSLTDKNPEQAKALGVVLALAEGAVRSTEGQAALDSKLNRSFSIALEYNLNLRAYENTQSTVTEDVIEGWKAFLAGEWVPTQPVRAARGIVPVARANASVRAPRELIDQVEAAADRMVAENGWPTTRGSKLSAAHVAAQWLALKYPEPETETAAE